jgi:hypothetical protein
MIKIIKRQRDGKSDVKKAPIWKGKQKSYHSSEKSFDQKHSRAISCLYSLVEREEEKSKSPQKLIKESGGDFFKTQPKRDDIIEQEIEQTNESVDEEESIKLKTPVDDSIYTSYLD